jgi:hypothetical protein
MIVTKKGSSKRDFDKTNDIYNAAIVREQAKVDEEVTLISTPTMSDDTTPNTRPSYVIVTFLLNSTGPQLRADWDTWTVLSDRNRVRRKPKKSMKLEDVEGLLNTLPSHLRRINRLKSRQPSPDDDVSDSSQQPYGFNIDILWTPNQYDETIEKIDIDKSYPFLTFL